MSNDFSQQGLLNLTKFELLKIGIVNCKPPVSCPLRLFKTKRALWAVVDFVSCQACVVGSLQTSKKQEPEQNRVRIAATPPLISLNQRGRISTLKNFIGLTDSSEYYRRILVRILIWVPPKAEFMIQLSELN